ncbi:hypothetical protein E2I00_016955, partial [Balaenoptera physalus]
MERDLGGAVANQSPPVTSGPGHSSSGNVASCQECRGCWGSLPSLMTDSPCRWGWRGPGTWLCSAWNSLNFEPMRSADPLALGAMEPPAHLSRLLASRKLEQVLERSRQLPTSSASLSHYRSPKPPSNPEVGVWLSSEFSPTSLRPTGQGLRYLEHLCLVLEQMARLQQLCLQLQTRRGPGDPKEEEKPALAPSPPPSHAPGSEVHGQWERLSQTEETGARTASAPKVGVPSASPSRLSEAPAEPAHTFPSSQGHRRDLSHWNKVKVLLNRIRWRSPRPAEPAAPCDGSAPRIASRDLPERPAGQTLQKTFMPSLVVKKQRAKNVTVGWGAFRRPSASSPLPWPRGCEGRASKMNRARKGPSPPSACKFPGFAFGRATELSSHPPVRGTTGRASGERAHTISSPAAASSIFPGL